MFNFYDLLVALILSIFAWSVISTTTNFLDDSLSILLGLDQEKYSNIEHILKPAKWAILALIYFVVLLILLYFFRRKLSDVFGMNIEALEALEK